MRNIRLTKRFIDTLKAAGHGKRSSYFDAQVQNLLLRVTDRGTKTFCYRKTIDGIEKTIALGRYPALSLEEARGKVLLLESTGKLPAAAKPPVQLLLAEIFNLYLEQHLKPNCASWKHVEGHFRRLFDDVSGTPINRITAVEIRQMSQKLKMRFSAWTANRAITDGKAAVNWAIKNGYIVDYNPFCGVPKFSTQFRDRFLTSSELPRFFAALSKVSNETIRDFFAMCLWTGARRSNVLQMQWSEIDLAAAVWRVPKTKSGKPQYIPLTRNAFEILARRLKSKFCKWVFPAQGKSLSGHLQEPKRAWKHLLADAGIENLRLHDLRRSLASHMAMHNVSLFCIAHVLGHQSASRATEIYARLPHAAVRQSMEEVQNKMLSKSISDL